MPELRFLPKKKNKKTKKNKYLNYDQYIYIYIYFFEGLMINILNKVIYIWSVCSRYSYNLRSPIITIMISALTFKKRYL